MKFINKLTNKQKIAIMLDKILIIIIYIIVLPFVSVFECNENLFQFLADFNRKCSDILVDVIAYKIYHSITNLIIKITGDK